MKNKYESRIENGNVYITDTEDKFKSTIVLTPEQIMKMRELLNNVSFTVKGRDLINQIIKH